jgi:hypothetical protein
MPYLCSTVLLKLNIYKNSMHDVQQSLKQISYKFVFLWKFELFLMCNDVSKCSAAIPEYKESGTR